MNTRTDTFFENRQGGQAMLIVVVIFLILMLALVLGVASATLSSKRIVRGLEHSVASFAVAESLLEDTIYRLNNAYEVAEVETLTLNSVLATAMTTDTIDGKHILVDGDADNRIRRVESVVEVGAGVAFNFGVQVGVGGFTMENNAGVEGNVYSNGNINGSNGAFVTGTAVAAGGLIDNVDVGTTTESEAWANQVTNSFMAGSLYCQTGSGNNKECDTSRADPETKEFPITQEDIDAWKAAAEAGGIIEGDYVVPANQTTQLGPVKITGSVTFGNNAVLEMDGPIWVEGNITTGNNSIIQLDASYGTDSEVFITDGVIALSNNTQFQDSGEEGSYIMLLTTSASLSAVSINNNAGTVIVNAQNGRVTFANNSGAKQATADEIYLNQNAIVTYESGLIDVSFNTGPSGGYQISSWEEVP